MQNLSVRGCVTRFSIAAVLAFGADHLGSDRVYRKLLADQTTRGFEEHLMTFASFNDLIGVEEKYRLAERFGVKL